MDRLFAFGHSYSLFLQPLRLVKRIPLTLFLRGDALEKHRTTGQSDFLVTLEHYFEGVGIVGTRMYGVSKTLINKVNARHYFLRPLECGVLRNDITTYRTSKKMRQVQLPLRAACVGILEPGKNQRLLLDVFKEIKANKAQLYFYGSGPDEQFLQETVDKEKMTDRVHFMGWVDSERIWPEVDLLLMPSLHEGAPNAVLEALGHGLPVLASDIPEHAEILSQGDLLPVSKPDRWIEFFAQNKEVISKAILELTNRQEKSCEKLIFHWEKEFAECISKK